MKLYVDVFDEDGLFYVFDRTGPNDGQQVPETSGYRTPEEAEAKLVELQHQIAIRRLRRVIVRVADKATRVFLIDNLKADGFDASDGAISGDWDEGDVFIEDAEDAIRISRRHYSSTLAKPFAYPDLRTEVRLVCLRGKTPETHTRWTVEFKDESAFDVWIENDVDAANQMHRLMDLSETGGYGEGTRLLTKKAWDAMLEEAQAHEADTGEDADVQVAQMVGAFFLGE